MRNRNHLDSSRAARRGRLAASAVALAAVAAALAAGPGNAARPLHAHGHASVRDDARLAAGVLTVGGSNADDRIALRLEAGDPSKLQVDFGDDGSAEFEAARADFAMITVDAGRGDDTIRIDEANGVFTDTIPTTLDGGAGDDNLAGGSGAETLIGGYGRDRIDGNRGNDRAFMGAGDDTFVWDPGDGSDTIEGEAGSDTMLFNGAAVPEHVDLSANGSRLRFFRDAGNVTMDTDGVERVLFNALGGADVVTVHDLGATDVKRVDVDESSPAGSGVGDGAADQVIVEGTNGNDRIVAFGSTGTARVLGLSALVTVTGAEPANDTLAIDALDGNDLVLASGLAGSATKLAIDGGNGNDVLVGGGGDDVIAGAAGNDVLLGGPGQDSLDGGPGSNVVVQ